MRSGSTLEHPNKGRERSNMRLFAVGLCALCIFQGIWTAAADPVEVCDGGTFNGQCEAGQEMVIRTARYGRMQLGGCLLRAFDELDCYKDMLHLMDMWCSGKSSCQVPVNRGNKDLINANPCSVELLSYLEVDYRCVAVKPPDLEQCRRESRMLIHGDQGVISSKVTSDTACGGLDTPWVMEASPGQRIHVSLVDFGWTSRESGELQPSSQCDVYGYISERRLGMNNTLCGGRARDRHVYSSASNVIEIQLLQTKGNPATFLLQYNVLGCPDMNPPHHAWYKRNGSTAVIGCEWSEHSWHLKCEGNTWVGVVGNCSSGSVEKPPVENGSFVLSPMLSVSLIVGLGALAIVLLCTIVIGYCCCRRDAKAERRTEQQQHPFGATYEGQAFLYHPGRPVPLQGNHATIHQQQVPPWMVHDQTMPAKADDLLHIWETPLPEPMTNPQDDSGIVSEPTYASLPSRGTMTGPCPSQHLEPHVNDGMKAGDVTWPGTRPFYDQGAR
nr:Gal-binding and CUB domains containing receptor 13 [Arenicola marina]